MNIWAVAVLLIFTYFLGINTGKSSIPHCSFTIGYTFEGREPSCMCFQKDKTAMSCMVVNK